VLAGKNFRGLTRRKLDPLRQQHCGAAQGEACRKPAELTAILVGGVDLLRRLDHDLRRPRRNAGLRTHRRQTGDADAAKLEIDGCFLADGMRGEPRDDGACLRVILPHDLEPGEFERPVGYL
jgi:hypothetical protein